VSEDETHALRRRCRDRFGPLPESVERLFLLADIRILAARKGLRAVATRQAKILLTLADGSLLHDQRRLPRFRTDSVTGRLKELKARIRLIPDSDPADHASGRN